MFGFVFLVGLFCGLVQAAPGAPIPGTLGVQFDKRSSLPTLTLPDATYQAYSYDSQSDVSPANLLSWMLQKGARISCCLSLSRIASITIWDHVPCITRNKHWSLGFDIDLQVQKHSLCSPSSRRSTLGKASASSKERSSSNWRLWTKLSTSQHQGDKSSRRWNKLCRSNDPRHHS